ncbi:CBS domain-containing protein [Hydrotalea sp.]|uniref:CBS domain-containing protein n=1 Tax=Hydrotalea sp. TaxID=2881279 RepID=UPI003D103C0A
MLVQEYKRTYYPILQLTDTAKQAVGLMTDYFVEHWPVCSNGIFVGILNRDSLASVSKDSELTELIDEFIPAAILNTDFIFTAVKIASLNHLTLVPVVTTENNLDGIVTTIDLLQATAHYTGIELPGGIIVLQMERKEYSFGEINRLVETNDAFITQLNSSINSNNGLLDVIIKINKTEISDVVATFQRYEYNVLYYLGDEWYTNELKDNYNNLMNYLNV